VTTSGVGRSPAATVPRNLAPGHRALQVVVLVVEGLDAGGDNGPQEEEPHQQRCQEEQCQHPPARMAMTSLAVRTWRPGLVCKISPAHSTPRCDHVERDRAHAVDAADAVRRSGTPFYSLQARSAISSARSMIAKPSSSCDSSTMSGGFREEGVPAHEGVEPVLAEEPPDSRPSLRRCHRRASSARTCAGCARARRSRTGRWTASHHRRMPALEVDQVRPPAPNPSRAARSIRPSSSYTAIVASAVAHPSGWLL